MFIKIAGRKFIKMLKKEYENYLSDSIPVNGKNKSRPTQFAEPINANL